MAGAAVATGALPVTKYTYTQTGTVINPMIRPIKKVLKAISLE